MRSFGTEHTFLSAVVANTNGLSLNVADYEHILIFVATSGSADSTLRVQASLSETRPTFSAARSATNRWHFVDAVAKDAADADIIGTTGLVFGGTDKTGAAYEVNTSGENWINVDLASRVAGTVTVTGIAYSN